MSSLTKKSMDRFMSKCGFNEIKEHVFYNDNVGIEYLKENKSLGYKEGWSVYFKRDRVTSVIRRVKDAEELRIIFQMAGRSDLSDKVSLIFS